MKPPLSWQEQADLLAGRGLLIDDRVRCADFLAAHNYYRFSGYMRYFQKAPRDGDDDFVPGTSFDQVRAIYEADRALRTTLAEQLAKAELLLRTHTAYVIANDHGPCGGYLTEEFYTDGDGDKYPDLSRLPVWSAVETLSFGTLSRCIERGAQGNLSEAVAASIGIAKAGFAYRVKAMVYLRNRCAHHSRIWNHSIIDAGPTPNNVRVKAKRLAGQFEPRSALLDVIASLDDFVVRGTAGTPALPCLIDSYKADADFWKGLSHPQNPRDHRQ
ncbi:Abi family protein [Gordonia paraffinivorans]|uniref:Abi family protein n=1 Tax=Gordonia paraffinivorans TaxID=175628 RepID=UPI003FCE2C1F